MAGAELWLVRHGETEWSASGQHTGTTDIELSDAGRRLAAALRERLGGIDFDRVLTSGLPRTIETAGIVAPAAEPEAWPDFRELEGRFGEIPPEELERAFVGAFDDVVPEDTRFLGGETIGSLFDRVIPALERLLADESWDIVLAVLHGGVNRAILSYALTGRRMFLGNLEQAPACIDVLDVGPSGWIVRAVNVTPYDLTHLRGRATTMEELWSHFRST